MRSSGTFSSGNLATSDGVGGRSGGISNAVLGDVVGVGVGYRCLARLGFIVRVCGLRFGYLSWALCNVIGVFVQNVLCI